MITPGLPKSKIVFNNRKIRVVEKYFPGKKGKIVKKFIVNVKGKIPSKLGKVKHTEILDEKSFWEFMEDYLDGRF